MLSHWPVSEEAGTKLLNLSSPNSPSLPYHSSQTYSFPLFGNLFLSFQVSLSPTSPRSGSSSRPPLSWGVQGFAPEQHQAQPRLHPRLARSYLTQSSSKTKPLPPARSLQSAALHLSCPSILPGSLLQEHQQPTQVEWPCRLPASRRLLGAAQQQAAAALPPARTRPARQGTARPSRECRHWLDPTAYRGK